MTQELLVNPITIEVSPENTTAETVEQVAYRCDAANKTSIAIKLIQESGWKQVLVFTRTKHGANRLSQKLEKAGIKSSAIHGNKGQGARTKALEGFKKGSVRVLVATDIAARGLDIADLPHVINFELPNVPEDYVHRIGRTGRAGKEGEAISLVCNDERPFLTGIEKLTKQRIPLNDIEGFVPELWPKRPPTASEVMKAANARKQQARQERNARKPRREGQGGKRKPNSGEGNKRSNDTSSSGAGNRRRRRRR